MRLADGSYPVCFGCRKLRQHPPGFGVTTLGESSLLPEATSIARRVLDEAGFVGVAGVEAKRHSETGESWFLEVNVRMPGQWGLGDACGRRGLAAARRALRRARARAPAAPAHRRCGSCSPSSTSKLVGPALCRRRRHGIGRGWPRR